MLTQAELQKVGLFDPSTIRDLAPALGFGSESITVTGSTLDPTDYVSELAVTGAQSFTLPAPANPGQRKRVICVSALNTPAGALTITSPDNTPGYVCAPVFTFTAAGQGLELVATSALR